MRSDREEGVLAGVRREFLSWLLIGLGSIFAAGLAVPFVGFFIGPLFRQAPKRWRAVGPPEHFPVGEMVLVSYVDPSPIPWGGVTAKSAAYIHRTSEHTWEAFSIHCTHLGCPVRWLPEARLFMCPCHGGVYYANGSVAGGPPPRSLVHMQVRERAGQIELLSIPVPIT